MFYFLTASVRISILGEFPSYPSCKRVQVTFMGVFPRDAWAPGGLAHILFANCAKELDFLIYCSMHCWSVCGSLARHFTIFLTNCAVGFLCMLVLAILERAPLLPPSCGLIASLSRQLFKRTVRSFTNPINQLSINAVSIKSYLWVFA